MTTDAFLVAGLFGFIWAAVLVPPVADARASRRAEFQSSIRPTDAGDGYEPLPGRRPPLTPMARRRHILGGLLVAMATTLLLGLLPTFRLLLVVHLLLVDSFLAYVCLLVHLRDRETRRRQEVLDAPPTPALLDDEPVRREREREASFSGVTVAAPRAQMADLANSA
jgi:hypothetical protein